MEPIESHDDPWIEVAQVGRPHGIRGEIRVYPYDPESDLFTQLSSIRCVFSDGREGIYEIRRVRWHKDHWIMAFEGISRRDQAEALKGARCWVRRSVLPPLEEDEFYYCDWIGLEVLDLEGKSLGKVLDLFDNGAHDVLVYGSGREMVPVVQDFVKSIDCKARTIRIVPMHLDDQDPE